MTSAQMQSGRGRAFDTLRPFVRGLGGPVFTSVLLLSAVFVLFLFDLRAEKIFSFPATLEGATREDVAAFWRAGKMALSGDAALAYDAEAFRAGLLAPNRGLLWLNPPHFLLVVVPLGLLSYPAAKTALLAAGFAALLLSARIANPKAINFGAILLSPAAFASALVMQLGPLVAAGLASALALSERRPLAAGFILSLLTMKPQYGAMAPIFLAAIGAWRTIGAAAGFSLCLMALSALVFGGEPWAAFFQSMAGGAMAGHGSDIHRDMVTVHQTIGKLGGADALRSAGQFAASLIAGGAVFFAARRWPRQAAIGFTLLASALASPSLWIYDWPIIAAGLFMLARASSPWPPHLQLLAGALWIAPLISLGYASIESSLAAPGILIATLGGFWFWGERLGREGAARFR